MCPAEGRKKLKNMRLTEKGEKELCKHPTTIQLLHELSPEDEKANPSLRDSQ